MQFVSFSQFSIIVLVLGIIESHLKVPFVQSLIVLRNLLREDLDASTHDRSYHVASFLSGQEHFYQQKQYFPPEHPNGHQPFRIVA